jgi:hypothetical protein
MRRSDWTPSIVPRDDDQNVYLVVDDLGRLGGVWREAEAEVEATDLETVIVDLLDGQYKNPVRIVGFNTAEKWSQDVSTEVAQKPPALRSAAARHSLFPARLRRPIRRPLSRHPVAAADPPVLNRGIAAQKAHGDRRQGCRCRVS